MLCNIVGRGDHTPPPVGSSAAIMVTHLKPSLLRGGSYALTAPRRGGACPSRLYDFIPHPLYPVGAHRCVRPPAADSRPCAQTRCETKNGRGKPLPCGKNAQPAPCLQPVTNSNSSISKYCITALRLLAKTASSIVRTILSPALSQETMPSRWGRTLASSSASSASIFSA